MNDKTLVERLRMTGKRISVPCPDGIDGCLVNHLRIETDPLCEEAATRIEALEAALRECIDVMGPMAKHPNVNPWLMQAKQALESQP